MNKVVEKPLSPELLKRMDAYWRAANYLSVGQIYLYDNPLLKAPLKREHIKPRLLGHWGTTPGLNFIYVHLNRLIKEQDLNAIYLAGPGHGGPGLVANTYLEGAYSEVYPNISQDEEGMKRLFKQLAATLDAAVAEIKTIQKEARAKGYQQRPRWPMIILRTSKGWTGPKVVDGKQSEGSFRSHQVLMSDMDKPEHVELLESWMKSYKPEELFDETGRLAPELAELAPRCQQEGRSDLRLLAPRRQYTAFSH